MFLTAARVRLLPHALIALFAGTVTLLAGATTARASAAAAAQCPGSLDEPSQATLDDAAGAVVCLVNAERTRRGLRALRGDPDLAQVAEHYSAAMVRRGFFAHVSPGGSDLGDRLRRAGYGGAEGWRAGEALGWGTGGRSTPDTLVDEWLASAPHRRLLLDSGFRELGVGVAAGAPQPVHSDLSGATYALELGVVEH
jgi:uncharacterized protein YkwD